MDIEYKLLNTNWKFLLDGQEEAEEAWYKGFDDSLWESVELPHDWSVKHPFEKKYSSGTGYLAGGIGWYRGYFTLPEEYRGKKISIVFDGIYKNSQVWCNSYHLGKRPNGYISFSYDISELVRFGDEVNEISVKVSHPDLADSRWFTGSGITRKVRLRMEEKVHAAEHGIFFITKEADLNQAEVEISHEIVNESCEDTVKRLKSRLITEDNREALVLEQLVRVKAGETCNVCLKGIIKQPKLWCPNKPEQYTLITSLADNRTVDDKLTGVKPENDTSEDGKPEGIKLRNGKPVGSKSEESTRSDGIRSDSIQPDYIREDIIFRGKVGIRSFRFDANQGFFLNGEVTKIKGVCLHHDGGVLGAAMYEEVWERRLVKLKKLGCNAIRTSHNPHMPELYDLCDRLGFLVMDEAFDEWENAKNKWHKGHNVYPPKHQGYAEDFPQWYEKDLTGMVRRDRNHPCVILWSIGNEIDYPNDPYCHPLFASMTGNNDANKPDKERNYDADKPNADRLTVIAKRLAKIVKASDGSRPVTLAAAFPELTSQTGLFRPLDVVGYNYKEHLYEQDHELFPGLPLIGSENSHSYQAWKAVTDNNFISGQFLWTGIDYLGEARGWPIHGSGAGLLTLAGFEKAEYYKRSALWSEEPVLAILTAKDDGNNSEWKEMTESFHYEPGERIVVRCYTNLPGAELFLNGESLGKRWEHNEFGFFEWHILYQPGILSCRGEADCGEYRSASLEATGDPCQLLLNRWDTEKRDILQIEATIADDHGRRVIEAEADLAVTVEGGELLGLENGDLSDNTAYSESHRRTMDGRLIIYVRRRDKTVRVTAAAKEYELSKTTVLEV